MHRVATDLFQGQLSVSEVQDFVWNDTPYDNLVLEGKHKDILTAFAERGANKTEFDDFVEHKGRRKSTCTKNTNANRIKGEGIIILLCGPPGVGKTLTAEAGPFNSMLYTATDADPNQLRRKPEFHSTY